VLAAAEAMTSATGLRTMDHGRVTGVKIRRPAIGLSMPPNLWIRRSFGKRSIGAYRSYRNRWLSPSHYAKSMDLDRMKSVKSSISPQITYGCSFIEAAPN